MSRSGAYYQSNPAVLSSFPGVQPPFQGPPPIPAGINVNPHLWNTGQWVFNPAAYQRQNVPQQQQQQMQTNQAAAWMASQHWSTYAGASQAAQAAAMAQAQRQAQQQGQSHNPYKRVIRPPSAEYLASKLVDNPLGLSNMIPREELYKDSENGSQHTPWVWNPRGLVEANDDDEALAVINADFRDENGRRIAQESRGLAPSRQGSVGRKNGLDPASMSSRSRPSSAAGTRHATDPSTVPTAVPPQRYESPVRHRSEPPPSHHQQLYASANPNQSLNRSSPSRRGSSQERAAPSLAEQTRLRERDELSHQRRNSDVSLSSSSQSQSLGRSHTIQSIESFTSHKELRPTFPSSIIRTPNHYSPARSSSTPVYSNHHNSATTGNNNSNSNASATGTAEAAQLAARIERMTLGSSGGRPGAELARHASLPTSSSFSSRSSSSSSSTSTLSSSSTATTTNSLSDVHVLSEEPTAMLSPLIFGTTPKPSSRSLARSHSSSQHSTSSSSIPGANGSGSSSLSSIPETPSPLNPHPNSERNRHYSAPAIGRNNSGGSGYSGHSPNDGGAGLSGRSGSRQSSRSRGPSPAVTPPQRSPSDPHFSSSSSTSPYANPSPYASASASRSPSTSPYSNANTTSTSPYANPPSTHRSSSRPGRGQGHAYTSPIHSQNTSPTSNGGGHTQIYGPPPSHSRLNSNPLPAPPVEIRQPLPPPPANAKSPPPPPNTYTRRVRKGFWNRRGDHLTRQGYVVYAPQNLSYPEDLEGYPGEREGYKDELGAVVGYVGSRPELPESLPWHGKQPERPYESFIEYEYQ